MKILMVMEFFPPMVFGGAELSTFYLAKSLVKAGHEVLVLTPNYGSKSGEIIDGVKVMRVPFWIKLNNLKQIPSSLNYINPIWIIWFAYKIVLQAINLNADVIHVNGKYSIPSAMLANLVLRKKVIITIRDYQVICNYGFCLFTKNKSCTLYEYFTQDWPFYLNEFVRDKNIRNVLVNFCYAIWGRLSTQFLKLCAYQSEVVVLSGKQKQIFQSNGFRSLSIVGNSVTFPKSPKKQSQRKRQIIYIGRLTPGKGVKVLIGLLPTFFKSHPNYKFIFAGEGFLKKDLITLSKSYPNIQILGSVEHGQLLEIIRQSQAVVVPSIWPEPFGRVPIDALSVNTPVLVSDRGALPEIVNPRWGLICKPDEQNFLMGIETIISKNSLYIKNITKDFELIKQKFGSGPAEKYLKIYQSR